VASDDDDDDDYQHSPVHYRTEHQIFFRQMKFFQMMIRKMKLKRTLLQVKRSRDRRNRTSKAAKTLREN
jgi:hypothetical protein